MFLTRSQMIFTSRGTEMRYTALPFQASKAVYGVVPKLGCNSQLYCCAKLKQPVKFQNPFKGELSHGIVPQLLTKEFKLAEDSGEGEQFSERSDAGTSIVQEVFGFVKENLSGAQWRKAAAGEDRAQGKDGGSCPRPSTRRPRSANSASARNWIISSFRWPMRLIRPQERKCYSGRVDLSRMHTVSGASVPGPTR